MPNEILIPLQSLVSCLLNLPQTVEAVGELKRLLFGMSQSYYLLSPSSCYPSQWCSSVLTLLCTKD